MESEFSKHRNSVKSFGGGEVRENTHKETEREREREREREATTTVNENLVIGKEERREEERGKIRIE